jgi:G3E family GTPase
VNADPTIPVPVNVITGFLGSGKTTLLRRLLASPELADTAVVINEFGEVGLDHLLLQYVDEGTVVLESGCVCCVMRSDLSTTLRDLYSKRERGHVPWFTRLAIETTGLAEPAPIIFTLMTDPVIRHHFRVGNIVTTIDAVNGARHLAEHPESVKQVAVADWLVVSKTDLTDTATVELLQAELRRRNPAAPILEPTRDTAELARLFTCDVYDRSGRSEDAHRWLGAGACLPHPAEPGLDANRHARDISAIALTFDSPLDWTAFGIWLSMLLHRHGDRVLRVKGILHVVDVPTPVVIHGVQHLIHAPVHLERWPTADHRTRLVLIVRNLPRHVIVRSLAAFNRLATAGPCAA